MGTSISQPSKRTPNWRPVFKCYENEKIPEFRAINEVWRASENDEKPISSHLKSEAIYNCFEAVKSSSSIPEAIQKFNQSILKDKNNSIVSEFAKRAIPMAFQSSSPSNQWINSFFSEVTNYIVSRDTSGFVGDNYRNKNVSELIIFKKNINSRVNQILGNDDKGINSYSSWNSYVDSSINKLKTN
jgi:hypothetical protein